MTQCTRPSNGCSPSNYSINKGVGVKIRPNILFQFLVKDTHIWFLVIGSSVGIALPFYCRKLKEPALSHTLNV